jgi:hypothetical protein
MRNVEAYVFVFYLGIEMPFVEEKSEFKRVVRGLVVVVINNIISK